MKRPVALVIALMLLLSPRFCAAAILTFENFAPPGDLVNISPTNPYSEAGFRITSTNDLSAVFDAAAASSMIGNNSDWFGFQESNQPSLSLTSPMGPFNLERVQIGPSTLANLPRINMTITGNVAGGGTLSSTFNGLTTATTETLHWANLDSVVFTATDDAALDNIEVSAIPEPAAVFIAALAGVYLFHVRLRRRR